MELTGFPAGVIASDANARANIGTVINAQKALSDLEARPVELEYKRSLIAENYGQAAERQALANQRERAAADLELMRKLGVEANAREAAIQAARVQGRDLTIGDVPPGGFSARESRAAPLQRMIDYARGRGAPEDLLAPLEAKASKVAHEEATTFNAQSEAEKRQLESVQKRADIVGTLAQAALKGPREYALARAQGLAMGVPLPEGLPMNFEAARPILQQLVDTSIDVKERAELAIKKQTADAATSRAGAAHVSAAAAVRRADAYVATSATRRDILKKTLGEGSGSAEEARQALIEARKARTAATENKDNPPAPLAPSAAHLNKTFTGRDGNIYMWAKNDEGKTGWVFIRQGRQNAAKKAAASPAMNEEDD